MQTLQTFFFHFSVPTFDQNKTYDEFFDSSSYPFQDERYGQDQEDRQWDSGGFPKSGHSKKLPSVPIQNYLNKNRSSILGLDEVSSSLGETFRPVSTPVHRRRMPQIPTRRSMSRQSSFNDENNHRTPDGSHRGASLPPTPTKAPKILSRVANHNKPFNSLPPTPGRQLPKPNVNYRSAKGRRNSLMKRTSSVEYTEGIDNYYDNSYTRPGAVSAREMHDDYYNYMYESSDNLVPSQIDTTATSAMIHNDNSSVNTLDYSETTHPFNQQLDNLYFNAPDEGIYQDQNYYEINNEHVGPVKPVLSHSLLPFNVESLECHDDELRDSFETAISSISSSLQRRGITTEYVTSADTVTANTTPVTAASLDSASKISSMNLQYKKDSPSSTYGFPVSNEGNVSSRGGFQSRGYLKQQESVDSSYFQQYLNGQHSDEYIDKQLDEEPYLEHQESVESYIEEVPNEAAEEHGNKAINNRESPASVIHMERFDDDGSLRRGSSQLTVIDPYHPMHPSARRSSIVDSRRTSGDLQGDEPYPLPSPRKASIDPYQSELARVGSTRRSPTGHQEVERYQSPTEEEIPEEKKSVLFEEEEKVKAPIRQQVTAQQRWLWAYNKIIMQLNVSNFILSIQGDYDSR